MEQESTTRLPASGAQPAFQGLSVTLARERLATEGANALPDGGPHGTAAMVLEVIREPMFLLLIAAAGVYLVLGDLHEALMLLFFVAVVMGITLYQSHKTERVLQALRDLTSPRALVLRDGEKQRIAGRDVVRDDIVMLAEGDRVPADALLLMCNGLQVDESLLTGEAAPVRKTAGDGQSVAARPGGDDLPLVYSGTLVVQGQGIARVTATGPRTEIGRIGKSLQALRPEPSPVQRQVRRMMWAFALLGVVLCGVVVVLYGLTRGAWLEALLAGITLAISLLPQEFLVVLTVFLALGAWRISRSQVLTRRIPALETLGAATILCADKTGTITENRMTVTQLVTRDASYAVDYGQANALPEAFHELVEFSVLASLVDPFDPMEKAFRRLADHYLAGTEHLHDDWTLAQHYPLSRDMLAMSHGWKATQRDEYVVAAKGAPEAIADLCHLSEAETAAIAEQADRLAEQGLRVLAMARATFNGTTWPPQQHDFPFVFLGMIALADPVRPRVPEAIRVARRAGMRVAMITGDYPGTAEAVAREAGIDLAGGILSGPEIDALDDAALRQRLKTTHVFARVAPEQKLRLVQAFKANGEVVAMTGDGVNDAPALKAAHIGIAMGGRGTDVAREASSLVLLDDDFATIVDAIRLGRRIFDNLHKAMAYILAVHVPIAGHGAAAAAARPAAGARAGAHRVSGAHHRPGLLDRVRSRAGRTRQHGAAAAPGGGAPVQPAHPAAVAAAGRDRVSCGGRGVCHLAAARAGRRRGACADLCHPGDRQSVADSGQPLLVRDAAGLAAHAEPRVVVGDRRHPRLPCFRALCARPARRVRLHLLCTRTMCCWRSPQVRRGSRGSSFSSGRGQSKWREQAPDDGCFRRSCEG